LLETRQPPESRSPVKIQHDIDIAECDCLAATVESPSSSSVVYGPLYYIIIILYDDSETSISNISVPGETGNYKSRGMNYSYIYM